MRVHLDIAWLLTVLLASIRVGMVFGLTPLLTLGRTPRMFRLLFVLALSALLVAVTGVRIQGAVESDFSLVLAAAGEVAMGGVLSFGVMAIFGAFHLAGRVLDLQLGFGVAALIDSSTGTPNPLLGTLLSMTAVIAFFAVDGHHMVVRGLAYSLTRIPPGTPLGGLDAAAIAAHFGAMFSFAAAVAAPTMLVLLLVDTALAVMARSMPQMNIFYLSFALKILVGLAVLALSMRYLAPMALRAFESIFQFWDRVLPE